MTVCECCVCLGFFAFCLAALCSWPILHAALLHCMLGPVSKRYMFVLFPCYWMHVLHGVDVIVPKDNDRDFCLNSKCFQRCPLSLYLICCLAFV